MHAFFSEVNPKDRNCKFVIGLYDKPASPSSDQPPLLLIIIASGVVVVLVISIVVTVVCLRRRYKKKKEQRYRSGSRRSEDIRPVGNFSPSKH